MKEREVPKRQCRLCTPVLLCVIMSGFFIAYTRGVGALCLPSTGCNTALAYYTLKEGDTLDIVGNYFQVSAQAIMNANSNITNVDTVVADESIYIPFACSCINGQLGQNFAYKVQSFSPPLPPLWFSFLAGRILIIVEKNVVFGLFVNGFSSILLWQSALTNVDYCNKDCRLLGMTP